MFQHISSRLGSYSLLLAVSVLLYLPNLGTPSLWDIDEGNNAECAREMMETGRWIVPLFNYQLRVEKPALLYWLQMAAYEVFGVSEFASRLPSALAAVLAVLAVYELGRRMFDRATGLLAGLVLASTAAQTAAAHFANPDSLLHACTLLSLYCSWRWLERHGSGWVVGAALFAALGVLAKGPVGLILPLTVVGIYALWARKLRMWLDPYLLLASAVFVVVALPWYAMVCAETKGQFLRGFFLKHNKDRFLSAMEGHHGPIFYYAIVLLIGLAPWWVILAPTLWQAVREARLRWRWRPPEVSPAASAATPGENRWPYRYLLCWIGVFFLFYSISSTKLPNYILPLYPALAILMGRYLERWRSGTLLVPNWVWRGSLAALFLTGIVASGAVLLAAGWVNAPFLAGRSFPGLEPWVILGLLLVIGAVLAWRTLERGRKTATLVVLGSTAVAFLGLLAGWACHTIDALKAPKPLGQLILAEEQRQPPRDIRIACYRWYQPSMVFYCRREVRRLEEEEQALDFLRSPIPVYLILPEATWQDLQGRTSARPLGRHYDFYRGCEVVVVSNR